MTVKIIDPISVDWSLIPKSYKYIVMDRHGNFEISKDDLTLFGSIWWVVGLIGQSSYGITEKLEKYPEALKGVYLNEGFTWKTSLTKRADK